MERGGGLAVAANFRTVSKLSVESTNACLTKIVTGTQRFMQGLQVGSDITDLLLGYFQPN